MTRLQSQYGLALSDLGTEPSPVLQADAKTLQDWLAVLRNDHKFCEAMDVLKACQTNPVLRELFGQLLPVLACLAIPRKGSGRRRVLEIISASKTGKTWKALREFPARLRGIADEVERINKSDFLSPEIWIRDDETKPRIIKGYFLRLPGVLRVYAAWMDTLLIAKMPAAWQRHFPPGPRGHSPFLFQLYRPRFLRH